MSEKIYSNKVLQATFSYIDKHLGKNVSEEILNELGVDRLFFQDVNDFQTLEFADHMMDVAIKHTGIKDLPYRCGRAIAESTGVLGGFVAGILSPSMLMKQLAKVEGQLARKTISHTKELSPNHYHIKVSFRDGFQEGINGCQNRIGCYESSSRFFGLPYANVEHPQCFFRGDKQCEYFVTIPEFGFIFYRKIALFLFFLTLIFSVISIVSVHSIGAGIISAVCLITGLLAYSFYSYQNAKKSMEWSTLTNEAVLQQKNELERSNIQVSSLQNLTVELNATVKLQDICEIVTHTLTKSFQYDSSQIWLLDDSKKNLFCKSAIGYSPDLMQRLLATQFEMGQGWDNPHGLLIQTLEQGKTLLVNDVDEALAKLSASTRAFLSTLKMSSFIITPLFDQQTPIGILSAENHHGKKVENKDKLLFHSISNIVANALVKSDLFTSLEEKIQERTKELEATTEQLMLAKEMAIQSEKMSSLGQMAAGVAHEINNPLNFLVNILPEFSRDIDALAKIRDLALNGNLDQSVREAITKVDEESDLSAHLEEKEYVFGRITKALGKSTQIANSLKVFSRTSNKEKISVENVKQMFTSVLEMIPTQVIGDTEVVINIEDDLQWKVNANEFEQAIMVLIKNAIEAMDKKGKVEVLGHKTPQGMLLLFKDQGSGIPLNIQRKIFDPFFTTKAPGQGTGLGLTIALEIFKKYGGRLELESETGKGATFKVTFLK